MKLLKFCGQYIFRHKVIFVSYLLINIIMSLLGVTIPLIVGKIVDNLAYQKSTELLLELCTYLVCANAVYILMGFISSYQYIKLQTQSGYALNKELLNHYQEVSMLHFSHVDAAYLTQRINNDANSLVIFGITVINNTTTQAINLILTGILLFQLNMKITLMLMSLALLYVISYKILKKPYYRVSFKQKELQAEFFARSNEQLSNVKFIKIHSAKEIFLSRLDESFQQLMSVLVKSQKLSYVYKSCDSVIGIIAQIIIYAVGGLAVIAGELTLGLFTVLTTYFTKLMGSVQYFFNLGKNYQDNLVCYNRIQEIFSLQKQKNGTQVLEHIHTIEIRNLDFQYGEKKILDCYSATLEKGHIYGLVGHNGAGKSTLIQLILGLYLHDYQGKIFFNESDIQDVDMNLCKQRLIGVTEQEPILIKDTLYNNITLGRECDLEQINAFVDILGLRDYVESLDKGLETPINEKSSNISGGEKQKISILRQLLKNPDVMIFDEPTSALDRASCTRFLAYLQKIKSEKIIILITHDEDAKKICDSCMNLNWESHVPA